MNRRPLDSEVTALTLYRVKSFAVTGGQPRLAPFSHLDFHAIEKEIHIPNQNSWILAQFYIFFHHLVKVYLTLGHEGHGFWLLQQTKIKQRLQIRALSLSLAYYFQKGGGTLIVTKWLLQQIDLLLCYLWSKTSLNQGAFNKGVEGGKENKIGLWSINFKIVSHYNKHLNITFDVQLT